MNKILVTYATNSGSTVEVGRTVVEEIQKTGSEVDFLPIAEVRDLSAYSAVVLGAPMILGWHRQALRFLRRNRAAMSKMPLAVFVTCMSLTKTGDTSIQGIPIVVDENLPKPPKRVDHLSFKENYSLPANYLRPILHACFQKPVSIAFFGGQLNFSRMQWWAMIFVILILQAQAGDKRNWDAIRSWAGGLPPPFNLPVSDG